LFEAEVFGEISENSQMRKTWDRKKP